MASPPSAFSVFRYAGRVLRAMMRMDNQEQQGERSRAPRTGAYRPALAKIDPLDQFSGAAGPSLFARGLFPGPSGPLLAKNRPKGRFFGRSKPPGPRWANRLRTVKQTISASLADVVKRVPGQSKGRAEAREKTGGKLRLGYPIRNDPPAFSRASALPLRGASRRATGEAGRPGTAALSNQHAEATPIAA